MKATYTSEFDDGIVCTSECDYDPATKTVTDIGDAINGEDTEVANANGLTDEYVTLPDGTELREDDGVTFEY